MAYVSTNPPAGGDISVGRGQIKDNFGAIETFISRDHVSFDANSADSGKHKAIRLTEQAAPATLVNELGLYAKDTGTEPNLFVRRESSGDEIQLTFGAVSKAANGYSYLPGGVLFQWGTQAAVSKAGVALTFPKAFTTTCYTIITNSDDSFYVSIANAVTNTGCTLKQNDSGSTHPVYWIAIGD